MSSPAGIVCPACHAAIAPGSAFCTRCGAATAVTEIAPVLAGGQQWGGARRRDRRGTPAAPVGGVPGSPVAGAYGAGSGAAVGVLARPAGVGGTGGIVLPHHPALGAAFDGVAPAGVGRRVGAYTLDLVAVLVVAGAVGVFAGPLYAALAGLELAVGLVVWEARSGRTLGNAVLGLRTAKEEAPFAPGLGRAVGRALVLGISHLTGVGQWLVVASSGFDRTGRGQAWHDRAAGTLVVDVRALRAENADADAVRVPVLSGPPAAPVVPVAAPVVPVVPAAVPPAPVPLAGPPRPPSPPSPPSPPMAAPAPHRVAAPLPVVQPSAPVAPVAPVAAPLPPATAPAPAPRAPAPTPPASAAPTRAAYYVLKLDSGQVFTVTGSGLIGRRPQAPPGEEYDHMVEVEDPGRSLSRTHARFGVDARGFWVEDRGSANGTSVQTDAGWSACVPGTRCHVTPGYAVRLGDRTVVVEAAS